MNAPDSMRASALGIALVLAALPLAGSAQDTGDVESARPITDTWITAKVKTELATSQGAKSLALDVRTVDGAVTLSGVLANEIAVQKAIATTNGVRGVKSVDAKDLRADSEAKPR